MTPTLSRRATAEAVGAALLVAVVVGSGISAARLSPDEGIQLLVNSLATAGGLVALILAMGPVSGAHLNPAVTLAQRAFGAISTREALAYAAAQVAGGCAGAIAANVMYGLDPVTLSTHTRSSGSLWFSEGVATFGLVFVVLAASRSRRSATAAFAVAGYIVAAYWFTSSTSFANPAVTIGRTLSDTFVGIAWRSAPAFLVAQLAGAAAAVGLARFLFPTQPIVRLVVAHDDSGAA